MSNAPRIVFLDRATIAPSVPLLRPRLPHSWAEHDRTAPGEVAARLAGAAIAITNKVPIDAATLAALPDLRMIAVAATGHDAVDVAEAARRGIVVANVRGYAVNSVPEHAMALLLALSRQIPAYRAEVQDGAWQRAGQFCHFSRPIRDLAGATLGIVGAGALGQAMAARARAFGMEVIFAARKGVAPPPGRVAFAAMLARADAISLHCPLTPQTRGLIGAAEFAAMARRPILINTARGGIVEEAAAAEALERGQISGLGVDVTLPEPPPADHPLMRIARRPDVILTPHVAWASETAMAALWAQVVENIEGFVRGRPLRVLG